QAAGLRFDAIRLTGGGSRSAAWRQMVADVFELPVEVPEQSEGAAFGAALQALWAHGRDSGGADIAAIVAGHVQVDPALSARPDRDAAAAYRTHYGVFLRHLETMEPLYPNHREAGVS